MCLAHSSPTAVACDIYIVRRSAHPQRSVFYILGKHFPNIKKISGYLANIEFVRYSEIKFDAAGRTRTGTATNRLILSQVRLPIPPQRLILSDKKIFLSESAFLCYHIHSHFSTIFYDFICFLFAKFLSNLKTIKCCKIVFRCLRTANHLYTSIFFQEQLC